MSDPNHVAESAEVPSGGSLRRPFLISAAVLGTIALVVIVGWFVYQRRLSAEVDAHAALKKLGVHVTMNPSRNHVHGVDFRLPAAKDHVAEAMEYVAALPYVEILQLSDTSAKDNDLAHIAGCHTLVMVALSGTSISDAGVAHLAGLRDLQGLYLAGTDVSPQGLAVIGQLHDLEILDLSNTDIAGDLSPLADLANLQHLILSGVDLDESAIETLGQLSQLSRLTISGSAISDEAIARLKKAGIQIDR